VSGLTDAALAEQPSEQHAVDQGQILVLVTEDGGRSFGDKTIFRL